MIRVSIIDMVNPLYQQERALRNRILLRPIGIPDFGWEKFDQIARHFVATDGEKLVGCVLLVPPQEKTGAAKLMQMAVDTHLQGQGTGRMLVTELLDFCRSVNITEVTCHAQQTAVPFYQKLGFEIYGEPFEEAGVLHRHMRIKCAPLE